MDIKESQNKKWYIKISMSKYITKFLKNFYPFKLAE